MWTARKLLQAAANGTTWFHRYRPAAVPLSQRIKQIEQVGDIVLVTYVAYLLVGALRGSNMSYNKKHLTGCPEQLVAQDFNFTNPEANKIPAAQP